MMLKLSLCRRKQIMKQISNVEHFRSLLIFVILLLLYSIVIGNLYRIQVQQQDFYKKLAEKQYNITITTLPERAYIYDRNGTPVAVNKDSCAAFLLPKQLQDKEKTIKFLEEHFPTAAPRLTSS